MRSRRRNGSRWLLCALLALPGPALAGPPYLSDDPQPTEFREYEIYLFTAGQHARDGTGGAAGIDFNYGAAPGVQLTAALPVEYEFPRGERRVAGLGNVELAAKVRFLRQSEAGWDVAFFPRVFLPSPSHPVGDRHASLLLPLWVQHDWEGWSAFGGGGCVLAGGPDSRNFCISGAAVTHQVTPELQIGAELFHQTPDQAGGRASTIAGLGLRYDLSQMWHVLAYAGPGLQHPAQTGRVSWYLSMLATF